MPRLIDADALKAELEDWVVVINKPQFYKRDEAIHIIDSAPTIDAVPVVRCGQCKFYKQDPELARAKEMQPELYCGLIQVEMHENDYCSYGEKKEGS